LHRQSEFVTVNKRNKTAKEAMNNWFAQRLGWLSFFINITAIGYCVLADNNSGAMAGLLLAYSFTIDKFVVYTAYNFGLFESKMISVERVAKFMDIEPESGYAEYVQNWSPSD
jgi:ABC-type multidrug transport system fused ATPase/permease subunit